MMLIFYNLRSLQPITFRFSLIIGLILLLKPACFAQRPDSLKKSSFLELGAGMGPSIFRDKATSPLFYRGVSLQGVLGLLKITNQKETVWGAGMSPGVNMAWVDEMDAGGSFFNTASIWHTRLYQLPGWSGDKWNYMAGGTLIGSANVRISESLQNNSIGLEAFANLMGSFKVSRDLSRTKEKSKKLLFINYKLKPRTRNLSYQLNVGLWNNSFRNGYAYTRQSGVINDFEIFENYRLSTFSGMRFSSELHYTLHLAKPSTNAVRISYIWDALRTPPGTESFEMARHTIRFSLLFNTK